MAHSGGGATIHPEIFRSLKVCYLEKYAFISLWPLGMDKTSFNHSEIKQATSTPKDKTGKDEKVEVTVELKACIECKYKCKKEDTLKKHMTTKHSKHKC